MDVMHISIIRRLIQTSNMLQGSADARLIAFVTRGFYLYAGLSVFYLAHFDTRLLE